ncbi:MAG: HAMP domain-containing histidine kinase [Bacteriovoracaceae bacterium]|nr:HAMP domain-containing histidine kinase [Bacteriovoracaceae bacterium]
MNDQDRNLIESVYQTHFKRNSFVGFLGCFAFLLWAIFDFILGEPHALLFLILRLFVFCFGASIYLLRNTSWYFHHHIRLTSFTLSLMIGVLIYITGSSDYPMAHFIGIAFIFIIYPMIGVTEVKFVMPMVATVFIGLLLENSWLSALSDVERYSLLFYSITTISFSLLGLYLQFQDALEKEKGNIRLKEGRIKLTRANEERKKLIRVLSHDLSNSLVLIQASVSRLKKLSEGEWDKTKAKASLDRLEKAGIFQQEVIEHVRMNEALKGGKIEVHPREVLFQNVINRAEVIFKDRFSAKRLKLNINLESEDLSFWADEVAFSNHVFNNLISNAIKFSFPETSIEINCYTEDESWVILEVKDHGMGMDKSILNVIFDSDKRTSRLGTQGEEGTGFGMPLMKSYVELFGGSISITSVPFDEGVDNSGTSISLRLKRQEFTS